MIWRRKVLWIGWCSFCKGCGCMVLWEWFWMSWLGFFYRWDIFLLFFWWRSWFFWWSGLLWECGGSNSGGCFVSLRDKLVGFWFFFWFCGGCCFCWRRVLWMGIRRRVVLVLWFDLMLVIYLVEIYVLKVVVFFYC